MTVMPLPPDTPPPIGPRGLAIRCAVQGREAFGAGAALNACPYGPARPYSRRAWVAGFVAGARSAGVRLADAGVDELDDAAPWPGDEAADA